MPHTSSTCASQMLHCRVVPVEISGTYPLYFFENAFTVQNQPSNLSLQILVTGSHCFDSTNLKSKNGCSKKSAMGEKIPGDFSYGRVYLWVSEFRTGAFWAALLRAERFRAGSPISQLGREDAGEFCFWSDNNFIKKEIKQNITLFFISTWTLRPKPLLRTNLAYKKLLIPSCA